MSDHSEPTDTTREITAPSRSNNDEPVTLDSHVFYQNRTTGQASQHPLTIRQLCRILGGKHISATPQLLTPDTQILRITEEGTYGNSWEPAREVPVVRQVVPLWHYEHSSSSNDSNNATTDVKGPISCRELAQLLNNGMLRLQTRVYSELTTEWKPIAHLPELQLAMDAFVVNEPLVVPDNNSTVITGRDVVKPAAAPVSVTNEQDIQDELNAFLSSTDHLANGESGTKDDDDAASYESDQGTRYVKDPRTGKWIHEALAPPPSQKPKPSSNQQQAGTTSTTQKRKKKAQFSSKHSKCWIYVTGLPATTDEQAVAQLFCRAGIIALDPDSQKTRVKLYRDKQTGRPKGDASICYARPESVELAHTLFDGAPFLDGSNSNANHTNGDDAPLLMMVERAKFEQRGDAFDASRSRVSNVKRKVAKLAAIQARDWDEGEFNGRLTGGRKGLRIIVLKGLFDPASTGDDDQVLAALEHDLRSECEQLGPVEKITVFSKHPQGVVLVKFTQPGAANEAVKAFDGRKMDTRVVQASFWDGVTDYTVRDEVQDKKEEEQRHEEFGSWLEGQEIPEELRLRTE